MSLCATAKPNPQMVQQARTPKKTARKDKMQVRFDFRSELSMMQQNGERPLPFFPNMADD
jgi:hypothetical protein